VLFSRESPEIAVLQKLPGQLKFCGIAGNLPYPCAKGWHQPVHLWSLSYQWLPWRQKGNHRGTVLLAIFPVSKDLKNPVAPNWPKLRFPLTEYPATEPTLRDYESSEVLVPLKQKMSCPKAKSWWYTRPKMESYMRPLWQICQPTCPSLGPSWCTWDLS
jgi:hypothetical protein